MSADRLTQDCEERLEECLDALEETVARMEHFSPTTVALALRLYLQALLQTLIEHRLTSREEVRAFIHALEHNTLPELWF